MHWRKENMQITYSLSPCLECTSTLLVELRENKRGLIRAGLHETSSAVGCLPCSATHHSPPVLTASPPPHLAATTHRARPAARATPTHTGTGRRVLRARRRRGSAEGGGEGIRGRDAGAGCGAGIGDLVEAAGRGHARSPPQGTVRC
jgi:hypothetical protein